MENEQLQKGKEEIQTARDKVRTTIEQIIHSLKDHERAMVGKLDDIDYELERCHTTQQERVQLLTAQLRSSVEYCQALLQRDLSFEILQAQQQTFMQRCRTLLSEEKVTVRKPSHVNYAVTKTNVYDMLRNIPGQVVTSYADASCSVVEGRGLEEAEIGREANFTVTTKDSEGKKWYCKHDQVEVVIEDEVSREIVSNVTIKDKRDGEYFVTYTIGTAKEYSMGITLNGRPLTGSPWRVQGSPYWYQLAYRFGSHRCGQIIAVSNVTGAVAVTDKDQYSVKLFSSNGKLIKKHVSENHDGKPTSVAFTKSGDIIIAHARRISKFTGELIFTKRIVDKSVKNFLRLSVANDDKMIVTDFEEKAICVLSNDGAEVVLSFTAPESNLTPYLAVYHQDLFFVLFWWPHCLKVFNNDGDFLYDIGTEGSGDEKLQKPVDVAIDKYNNLIVCDNGDQKIKVFTLDGSFLNLVGQDNKRPPSSVATSSNGYIFVSRDNVEAFF